MENPSSRPAPKLPEDLSTAIALLKKADELLVAEFFWTKGVTRRNWRGGRAMGSFDTVSRCVGGAVLDAGDKMPRTSDDFYGADMLLNRAMVLLNGGSPAVFRLNHGNMVYVNYNDLETTTFADIKCLIQVAIRLGEHDHDVSRARQPQS